MSWTSREMISKSVLDMLRVNMGFKQGEKLLVISDVPRLEEWNSKTHKKIHEMLERADLARLVAEIAADTFGADSVTFWPFFSTGSHGAEPDDETAARMRAADVVIALTTYSLSHTNARAQATESGARLASMPQFEAPMFAEGGPMASDPRQVSAGSQLFGDLLTQANQVHVTSPAGPDLHFSIEGREGQVDDGIYGTGPGKWGNLPAGEAYTVPVEGTGQGILVAPAGWYPELESDMTFTIVDGLVVDLQGGGKVGDKFRRLLDFTSDDPIVKARRNLAELGIGCNPNASKPDNVLEAEKIKGTVHIAIGDNIHMGGQVEADLHDDFVQPNPDLILDGKTVIAAGEWMI
jgi:leucyl aminopeptidase (aminopeptidase T)